MRVALQVLGQLGGDGLSRGIVNAFGHRHDAAAQAVVGGLHVGQEALHRELALGQVDQVRAVVVVLAAQRRGRRQKPGVPPHDHGHVHARQRGVVQVGPRKGLGHEARGRGKAGRVVVAHQIVVDGLRDVDAAQRIARPRCLLADDAHGVGRVVAADVEEVPDAVRLQHLEDLLAVLQIRLVARGAERRARGAGHELQVVAGLLRQIEKVFVDDAAHAMPGAVHPLHAELPARLQHHAHQGLVDHRRRAASLGDQNLAWGHVDALRC